MEFNLNLSTNVSDIISYSQGNINNISGKLETGVFDNILDKSFCDSDESEDIDYNLILNLLNNLKLFNNQENFTDIDKVYTELDQVESLTNVYNSKNEIDYNIETNDYKLEKNLLSSEELEILSKLKNNFENESKILSNKTTKTELNDQEIEVLKKFDDIISKNKIEKPEELFKVNKLDNNKLDDDENNNTIDKLNLIRIGDLTDIYNNINESDQEIEVLKKNEELFKVNKLDNSKLNEDENTFRSNLVYSKKFSQLENSNTVDKLNLIRSNDLDKSDEELDTLESILSVDCDNNFIVSNNQLINKDLNLVNTATTPQTTTIRQEYIGEDIIKTVKYLKSSGQETITIKISPEELGDMTINLINNQDESSVVITISKSDVFDLVNDNQGEIVKHLKDLNINIKEISIEMKDNTQNNFSSNFGQEFERNKKGNKQENKKYIRSIDEEVDDIEEIYIEENVNILI